MSSPALSRARGRRIAGIAALGAGAALAAGWAAQRRLVRRSSATADDIEAEGLFLPPDVVHQDIEMDDGGRIHVVSRGEGQPLVLLHGVCLNSGIWAHQLSDLSDEMRVIALDLRGHGQSVTGSDGFLVNARGDSAPGTSPDDPVGDLLAARSAKGQTTKGMSTKGMTRRTGAGRARRIRRMAPPALERLALDVRQVLRALDVEGAVLVGHSMGGMVAVQAVSGMAPEERSKRLSGLVLTSTTTGPFLELPGWDLFASIGSPAVLRALRVTSRAGRGAIPKGDIRWWASRLAFGAEAPPAQVRFLESMLGEVEPQTMEGLLESLARVNLTSVLPSVDLPTLITVGTHDRLTPPWHSRRLESRLPNSRLVELARCGHMPMLERRREFDRLLEEHARKVS
jgi:pimeloyl-ACP methyl ester carboxylesterase